MDSFWFNDCGQGKKGPELNLTERHRVIEMLTDPNAFKDVERRDFRCMDFRLDNPRRELRVTGGPILPNYMRHLVRGGDPIHLGAHKECGAHRLGTPFVRDILEPSRLRRARQLSSQLGIRLVTSGMMSIQSWLDERLPSSWSPVNDPSAALVPLDVVGEPGGLVIFNKSRIGQTFMWQDRLPRRAYVVDLWSHLEIAINVARGYGTSSRDAARTFADLYTVATCCELMGPDTWAVVV